MEVCGGTQRYVEGCAEVCGGVHGRYTEVHGGTCRYAEVHRGVHRGMQRGAQRYTEVCGGTRRGAWRYAEGCAEVRGGVDGFDWITSLAYQRVFHLNII